MSLPTDVVDYILSFVEVATLQACAQSHPILSQLSERHLYSDIILHDELRCPDRYRLCLRISQLTKRLSNSPYIANYVRHLTIYGGINLEDISSTLPKFLQLRKFTLSDCTGRRRLWQELPKKFHSAFLDTLNLRSLKDVSIERISGFPLSLLDNCERVRSLTLWKCSFVGPGSGPGPDTLESLSIRDCDEISLRNIIAWVRTRSVRLLEFSQPFELLPQLLSACANSLTDLNLDIVNELPSQFKFYPNDSIRDPLPTIITFPFTLSTVPHLKKLTIRSTVLIHRSCVGRVPCWDHDSEVPLAAITQLITTAPSSLKELMLEINFIQGGATESLPNADVIWSPLISLATKCSSLSIKVYLSVWSTRAWGIKPLPAIFSPVYCNKMMQFVERGVLVFMPLA